MRLRSFSCWPALSRSASVSHSSFCPGRCWRSTAYRRSTPRPRLPLLWRRAGSAWARAVSHSRRVSDLRNQRGVVIGSFLGKRGRTGGGAHRPVLGLTNQFGWSTVAIYGLLTLGYGSSCSVTRPTPLDGPRDAPRWLSLVAHDRHRPGCHEPGGWDLRPMARRIPWPTPWPVLAVWTSAPWTAFWPSRWNAAEPPSGGNRSGD